MLDLSQMILVLKLKKLFLIEINKLQKVKQNQYLNQKILQFLQMDLIFMIKVIK